MGERLSNPTPFNPNYRAGMLPSVAPLVPHLLQLGLAAAGLAAPSPSPDHGHAQQQVAAAAA